MTAYDMMLSESQERMLAVLKPGREARGRAHLQEMGTGFRRDRRHHRHAIGWSSSTRARSSPTCRSRRCRTKRRSMSAPSTSARPQAGDAALTTQSQTGAGNRCRRFWPRPICARAAGCGSNMTTRVMADTVQRPGGDAAVVRVHGTQQGAGDHHRCDAALLPGRSVRRRASRRSPKPGAI